MPCKRYCSLITAPAFGEGVGHTVSATQRLAIFIVGVVNKGPHKPNATHQFGSGM